jgi:hypothetical protein
LISQQSKHLHSIILRKINLHIIREIIWLEPFSSVKESRSEVSLLGQQSIMNFCHVLSKSCQAVYPFPDPNMDLIFPSTGMEPVVLESLGHMVMRKIK